MISLIFALNLFFEVFSFLLWTAELHVAANVQFVKEAATLLAVIGNPFLT